MLQTHSLTSKMGTGIVVGSFLLLSLTTTGVAASKLWSVYQTNSSLAAGPLEIRQIAATEAASVEPTKRAPVTKAVVKQAALPTQAPTPLPTPRPSFALVPLPQPSPTPLSSSGCIITLSGKQYDVTPLRSSHPGGDIFVCGTDMTASYNSRHGSDLSRMTKYQVTNTTGAPVSLSTPKPSSARKDDHDEEESDDEKRRYIDRDREEEDDD
jgi:hypothetical protein